MHPYDAKNTASESSFTETFYISDYAVYIRNSAGPRGLSYLHGGRLGAVDTVTGPKIGDFRVEDMRGVGPFGKVRGPELVTDVPLARDDSTRGFTQHEHLDRSGLIHMNGRLYDHNLGWFLSVDPVI